jgi:hypothetical protein
MEVPNQSLLLSTTFKVRETHPSSPAVFPSMYFAICHSHQSLAPFQNWVRKVLKICTQSKAIHFNRICMGTQVVFFPLYLHTHTHTNYGNASITASYA